MDCHFWDLPDFQSSEARLMTASAASTFNQLQRNLSANDMPGLEILARQYTDQWTQYSLNLWTAEAVINRVSELWKSGKSRKWQSIRNYT